MTNRRFQFALDFTASGRQVGLRVSRHILNVIVVGLIIAIAIITSQLADGSA
ncbi:MAG TPA: hypothetical protein VJ810_41620 [Blastocatellia bacterium]|nr:hypothetical protein [Blastocatellia bacterium]